MKDSIYRAVKYILIRTTSILLTIFVGVFITVLISNRTNQIDLNIEERLETQVRQEMGFTNTDEARAQLNLALENAMEEAGLNLPFWPRHLRWTYNALMLNWGDVRFLRRTAMFFNHRSLTSTSEILLDSLPNTLVLVGVANLLIFMIGIPLSLQLSRKHNGWKNKLFSFLAPLSSIPSWVHGSLLILIFAVELHIFPLSGMFDLFPPEHPAGYFGAMLRHMVLPVSAIILSLLFQLIYTWRAFFLIFSTEDYVELARAKGLTPALVERKYILRPSAPFIVTSFALIIVGFWQMNIALEVVFDWPGLGKLYIDSLPHFWGLSMFEGEMVLAIAVVVLFAYILGCTILVLDVVYMLLDPRVRLGQHDEIRGQVKQKHIYRHNKPRQKAAQKHPLQAQKPRYRQRVNWDIRKAGLQKQWEGVTSVFRELMHYPSAIIGMAIILILMGGSIYAIVALPYAEIGERWYSENLTGNIYVPKLAQPAWTNLFREKDLLSTIIFRDQEPAPLQIIETSSGQMASTSISYTFEYPYAEAPKEMFLNVNASFKGKKPFVSPIWITPDGQEFEMKSFSVDASKRIDLVDLLPRDLQVAEDAVDQNGKIPALSLLFQDTSSETLALVPGTYQLRLKLLFFEVDTNLEAELVVLGQVYGFAGTDYMRRDLLVPLLWGMPFALVLGLVGATVTTTLSMIIAATGVWMGGWADGLAQRLNEAVMILPILAVSVLLFAIFNISLWTILGIIVFFNIFGSPIKTFRAAFIQIKASPYIEAAQAYGASNWRIILHYMIPRVTPVLIPQLVALIPSYVFLEATLGMFNINSTLPTWGKVIYDAFKEGRSWGSPFWVLQPIGLLLLTGFAFTMLSSSLNHILNPQLRET